MNRDDSLKAISELSSIIGILEHKWERPMSDVEAKIIQALVNVREAIRKEHEEEEIRDV